MTSLGVLFPPQPKDFQFIVIDAGRKYLFCLFFGFSANICTGSNLITPALQVHKQIDKACLHTQKPFEGKKST